MLNILNPIMPKNTITIIFHHSALLEASNARPITGLQLFYNLLTFVSIRLKGVKKI